MVRSIRRLVARSVWRERRPDVAGSDRRSDSWPDHTAGHGRGHGYLHERPM